MSITAKIGLTSTQAGTIGAISGLIFVPAGFSLGPLIMGGVADVHSVSIAWKIIGIVMIISTMMMLMLSIFEKRKTVQG